MRRQRVLVFISAMLFYACNNSVNPFQSVDCPPPGSENNSLIITNITDVEVRLRVYVFNSSLINADDCTGRCDQSVQDEVVEATRTHEFSFNSSCKKEFEGTISSYGLEMFADGESIYSQGWDERSLKLNIQLVEGEYIVGVD